MPRARKIVEPKPGPSHSTPQPGPSHEATPSRRRRNVQPKKRIQVKEAELSEVSSEEAEARQPLPSPPPKNQKKRTAQPDPPSSHDEEEEEVEETQERPQKKQRKEQQPQQQKAPTPEPESSDDDEDANLESQTESEEPGHESDQDDVESSTNRRQQQPDPLHGVAKKSKRITKSAKAGLVMPVGRVLRKLKEGHYANRISDTGAIYMAATLEYLVAEVLELAGNCAKENRKHRITPRNIMAAIRMDEELDKLVGDAIIPESGVMPHIEPVLLPKRSKEKRTNSQEH